jgi:hypothetical protein
MSICAAVVISVAAPAIAADSFNIVKSFPISEPSWGAKVGNLYVVAAYRALLVYEKTGGGEDDYHLVNQIFSGLDGKLENGVIDDGIIYLGASKQGLIAYEIADLTKTNVTPALRFQQTDRSIGSLSLAGNRLYATYHGGGIGVFDKGSLSLLGEGLMPMFFLGLTAVEPGVVYASSPADYTDMLVIDARNPAQIDIVQHVKGMGHAYPTFYYWPASISNQTLYVPEFNGGVGAYDLTNPLNLTLRFRFAPTGLPANQRNLKGAIKKLAMQEGVAYFTRDNRVETASVGISSMTPIHVFPMGPVYGPDSVWVNQHSLAVPTFVEGIRFFDLTQPETLALQMMIDLPSRIEGIAKVGRMVYVTSDTDGVWQLDWEAPDGPTMSRRIELYPNAVNYGDGLSEDLTLYQNHLYVADGIGLGVIDVSDKNHPQQVFYWDFPYPGGSPNINQGWVEGVDAANGILYVALGPGGMATFDVSNPAQPVHLKTMTPGTWGNDVVVESTRKLVSFTGLSKFALVNVADPSNPVVLSNNPVPNGKNTMGSAFSPDGNFLVVCQSGTFSIYNITNPQAPVFLKTYDGSGSEGALFFNKYLLVSGRGSGTGVWEIGSSPADLTYIKTLPCYFYNSKFWVEGDHIFTNSEGADEIVFDSNSVTSVDHFGLLK